ncbi:MAG: 50S ribosomal protein L4 [Legionellales bacterium]|nr:50S ribosomal protein L4 [Legionellales bacterium]|tara:strand:+ start:1064 stop:1684 length:621 start_codon:yes stop_codon:yes gene_type:complete
MELQIKVPGKAKASGSVEVSDAIFAREYNEGLIHQVVTSVMTNQRQGTKAQKNRSAVSGGGAKPWRQKGTGRARAGTTRSPIWRKGGVTFAAKPRKFDNKINKKMYRGAMQSILAELVRQERLVVVEDFTVAEAKTKLAAAALKSLELENVLIVTEAIDMNLFMAARNIPRVSVATVDDIDPVSLIAHENVLMTVAAVKKLEENLG